jgi:hypothetical protein
LGAICADVKKVTATNSKDSAKQDDEYSDHRPYSNNLAPFDFHIFGPLKDVLRGQRFVDNYELEHGVREELRRFSKEFHATDIERLTQRRNMCGADDEGDFVEK